MSQLNTANIVKVMREMADDLRSRAAEIERRADDFIESGDLDECVAALSSAISTQNLHAERLLNSTIRELRRAHEATPKNGEST